MLDDVELADIHGQFKFTPRFRATSLSSFSAAHSEPVSYLPDTLQRMAAL